MADNLKSKTKLKLKRKTEKKEIHTHKCYQCDYWRLFFRKLILGLTIFEKIPGIISLSFKIILRL